MRVPDWRKERRAYIRKKTAAVGKQLCGHMLFSVAIGTLLSAAFTAVLLFLANGGSLQFPLIAVAVACALAAMCADRFIEAAEQEENAIEFVPAFRMDRLTAHEVLVRMSAGGEQPHSASMLRPVNLSARVPEAQLLRIVSNGGGDYADD